MLYRQRPCPQFRYPSVTLLPLPTLASSIRVAGKLWLLAALLAFGAHLPAQRSDCATPGADGNRVIVGHEVINAYFAGITPVLTGDSLWLEMAAPGGVQFIPEEGSLLLIIQMQGADIILPQTPTSTLYGAGTAEHPMHGWDESKPLLAGNYEYSIVKYIKEIDNKLLVKLHTPLINSYIRADANHDHRPEGGIDNRGQGNKRYQIIWVPQYTNLSLNDESSIQCIPWNGETGGVIAADINGFLDIPENAEVKIDASGLGFRGGGARPAKGAGVPAWVGPSGNDEPSFANGSRDEVYAPLSANRHGAKGEGVAGTPAIVYQPATAFLPQQLPADGYPGGSFGRGAPGNAGGGGTDAECYNAHNAGGGGGGNAGTGGNGGNTAYSTRRTGGRGGAALPTSPERLLMGGGGGAGSASSQQILLPATYASSGAPGGGIIALTVRNLQVGKDAKLTFDVSGADAPAATNAAAGGGGAGGSILLLVKNSDVRGQIEAKTEGGEGGNTDAAPQIGYIGPGGGGGGGMACLSLAAEIEAEEGDEGLAYVPSLSPNEYGATDGEDGGSQAPTLLGNVVAGYECVPLSPSGTTIEHLRVYLVQGVPRLFWNLTYPDPSATFEIQRSLNGNVFDPLPTNTVETIDGQQFAYYDNSSLPAGGNAKLYYRIRYQNPAGSHWLSPIAELAPNENFKPFCTPAPNPANGVLHLTYDLGSSPAYIQLFDLSGKVVHSAELDPIKSATQIDISAFYPGSYLLKTIVASPEFSGTLFSRVLVY